MSKIPFRFSGFLFSIALSAQAQNGDQVQIKMTAREDQIASTVEKLGLGMAEAERFDVYFFETRSLQLLDQGLTLRARLGKGAGSELTVRLRPFDGSKISRDWFAIDGFKCELEYAGERPLGDCSLKLTATDHEVDHLVDGTQSLEGTLTADQHRLLQTYSPVQPLWNSLVPMGPIAALAWKQSVAGLDTRLYSQDVVADG